MSGKLKILVPLKKVVDSLLKPTVNATNTGVNTAGLKHSVNPFCDIALEEALRLKEKNGDLVESVHAVTIGPQSSKDILTAAMAKGAMSSTLIESESDIEPLAVAKVLKQVAEAQKSNLIILGKQTIDSDANQTGQILASLLNWPQATFASKVVVSADGKSAEVSREVDGGSETVKADLPMVITTDLRLNTPRYTSLAKLMKAKRMKIEQKKIGDYAVDTKPRLQVVRVEEPPKREPGIMVESVEALVAELKKRGALA